MIATAAVMLLGVLISAPAHKLVRIGGGAPPGSEKAVTPLVLEKLDGLCGEIIGASTGTTAVEFSVLADGKTAVEKGEPSALGDCLRCGLAGLSISRGPKGGSIRYRLKVIAPPRTIADLKFAEPVSPSSRAVHDLRSDVQIAGPEIDGGHDAGAIAAAIKARRAMFRACHERVLKRNPSVQGKLVVKFAITADGGVDRLEIAHDTAGDTELRECVLGRMKYLRFAKGSQETRVLLPVVFKRVD